MFETHCQPIFGASMLTQRAVCAAPAPRRASPTPRSCEVRKPKAAARAAGRRRSLGVQRGKRFKNAGFSMDMKGVTSISAIWRRTSFDSFDTMPCGWSDSKISVCIHTSTYISLYNLYSWHFQHSFLHFSAQPVWFSKAISAVLCQVSRGLVLEGPMCHL